MKKINKHKSNEEYNRKENLFTIVLTTLISLFFLAGNVATYLEGERDFVFLAMFTGMIAVFLIVSIVIYKKNSNSSKLKYILLGCAWVPYIITIYVTEEPSTSVLTSTPILFMNIIYGKIIFARINSGIFIVVIGFLHFTGNIAIEGATAYTTAIILFIAFVVISYYLSSFLAKKKRALQDLETFIGKISDFDLSFEDESVFQYKDEDSEIGSVIRSAIKMSDNLSTKAKKEKDIANNLNEISKNLSRGNEDISLSAEEVSMSIQDVASGSEEQTAQVETTQENMQDLVAQIDSVEQRSNGITQRSVKAKSVVKEGKKLMDNSLEQLSEVKKAKDKTDELGVELADASDKIGKVVEFISEIVEQTNLLALNASIEAARAGRVGLGFSVVAEEIRDLSVKSADSIEQIEPLVKGIREKVNQMNNKQNKAGKIIQKTSNHLDESHNKYEEVETTINDIADMIEDTNNSIEEIMANSNAITGSMKDIAVVSEQSSATAEEVAAASEEQSASCQEVVTMTKQLKKFSDYLKEMAEEFKI